MSERSIKQEFDLQLAEGDDGLLEIDWGTHVTEEPLEKLVHMDDFNRLFGQWRAISWNQEGQIRGTVAREPPAVRKVVSAPVAEPANRRRSAPDAQEEALLAGLRPKLLKEFSRTGQLVPVLRELMKGTPLERRHLNTVYGWLTVERSPHYDAAWHHEYLRLKEEKPWKQAA